MVELWASRADLETGSSMCARMSSPKRVREIRGAASGSSATWGLGPALNACENQENEGGELWASASGEGGGGRASTAPVKPKEGKSDSSRSI